MKQLVLGILAHVDAGKTTLSEALLYRTGAIRDLPIHAVFCRFVSTHYF